MAQVAYFDELSADDSNASASSSENEDDISTSSSDTRRFVLHADVDCFYCQCEQIDNPDIGNRPLAIGQKHIIVTCNYVAREMGVGKLMLREEAYRRCPNLLILEGSDLERYRVHSRAIYESFRKACKESFPGCSVAKGSMDEMMAGIPWTPATECADKPKPRDERVYVYGEGSTDQVEMIEDQTGASTWVSIDNVVASSTERHSARQRDDLASFYRIATTVLQVRERILSETGFTTTIGLSTNPLLAKLASGLKKPANVNVLEPGSSCQRLVSSMPLRKLTGVGRGTMKYLVPCLERYHGKRAQNSPPWTCGDLLQLSRTDLVHSFRKSGLTGITAPDTVMDLCLGMDTSSVVDDGGGIQKTLSVENSFRRGTVTTKEKLSSHMEDIYHRLPRLLRNRTSWSTHPAAAFPTQIRLTVRVVDRIVGKGRRRPFVTTSAQRQFDGRALLRSPEDLSKHSDLLREASAPLFRKLIGGLQAVDVTRVNVALCGFQDIPESNEKLGTTKRPVVMGSPSSSKRQRIDEFFAPAPKSKL